MTDRRRRLHRMTGETTPFASPTCLAGIRADKRIRLSFPCWKHSGY